MCDYATSVYEKRKICCINTKYRDSSLHFPKQSRQHLIIQAELLIERQDQSLQRLLAIFPLFLLDPDRAVFAYIIFMPIIKRKTEKERKDG
jgi:hypothetical protein